MSNPFEPLVDMYDKNVEENDKKGYSELYKTAFLSAKKWLFTEYKIEITDIEYLDGYFIFGTGTNSVIHFKVKGCKHWKFGIWWSVNGKGTLLKGELFAQHERYINKFKPSYSEFNQEITFQLDGGKLHCFENDMEWESPQIVRIIKFIKYHKYLAFYRDCGGADYNIEKQRPIKVFFFYYADGIRKWWRDTCENWMNKILVRKLKEYAKKEFEDCNWEIHDEGENCSPRYELHVELSDEQLQEQKTGCYNLFNDTKEEEVWEKREKRLRKFVEVISGRYAYSEVSTCLIFWNKKELEKYPEEKKRKE